jgi:AT-rich DNA-binding protein
MEKPKISRAALERLPAYLRCLTELRKDGIKSVSSTVISEKLGFHPVQVRKDLSLATGVEGRPRTGFAVSELIASLEHYLGYDNRSDAVLIGAGKLGRALMSYEGFSNYGLNIVAAFDISPKVIGTTVSGKRILDFMKLETRVKNTGVRMGIIAVPKTSAQEVADKLIAAGVKGIWNFAPINLSVPKG